jgi:hypothetical protein
LLITIQFLWSISESTSRVAPGRITAAIQFKGRMSPEIGFALIANAVRWLTDSYISDVETIIWLLPSDKSIIGCICMCNFN